jgi:hypothetical protein
MLVKPPKDFLLKNIITDENIYKNYEIEIDNCLVEEIKDLWSKGIHTTGCCCGHNDSRLRPSIGVQNTDIQKMIDLGYKMFINEFGSVEFTPKTKCKCKGQE